MLAGGPATALFGGAVWQRPFFQISGGPQQGDADTLVLKIGVLKKQKTFRGLHAGVGQFVQRASICIDARLSRFEAGLRQLVFELRHFAGGFELLGGALQF